MDDNDPIYYGPYEDDAEQPSPHHPREPQHSTWRTPITFILVLILIGVAGWYFWPKPKDTARHQPPVVIQTAAAVREDVPVYLDGLGTISAYNTVTVHTQVAGHLDKVLFNEGQDVHEGDLLAIVDPRTYQAAYDSAVATRDKDAANLENAQRDLTRYENLGADIAHQILDTQRATVAQLTATVRADNAAIENTRAQLSYTHITAPINGRTGIRQVDVGNLIQPGDTGGIVVLTQLQPISVIFSLPQQDLQNIMTQINAPKNHGTKLTVLALGQDNKTIVDTGVLELVDNQIDQTTGTIKLKSTFPNKDHLLWPGGFTNVRLLVTTQQNVLTVPTVAIQRGPQGTYVYLLQVDKTVKIRPVTVGLTQDDITVITDGLQDADQVATDGMVKLQDGSKVMLASDQKPDTDKKADAKPDDKSGGVEKHHHDHKEGGSDKSSQDKPQ